MRERAAIEIRTCQPTRTQIGRPNRKPLGHPAPFVSISGVTRTTSSQHLKRLTLTSSVQSAVAKSFDGVASCMVPCEALGMLTLKKVGTYSGENKSVKYINARPVKSIHYARRIDRSIVPKFQHNGNCTKIFQVTTDQCGKFPSTTPNTLPL